MTAIFATERQRQGYESTTDAETRKAAACNAFWSDAPLNLAYRKVIGQQQFTLKAFMAFVLSMSADQFARLDQ